MRRALTSRGVHNPAAIRHVDSLGNMTHSGDRNVHDTTLEVRSFTVAALECVVELFDRGSHDVAAHELPP